MTHFSRVLLSASLLALGGCAQLTQSDHDVRTAATNWLNLLDTHAYKQAYSEEVPRVKQEGGEDRFVRFMQSRRAPLGNGKTREFIQVVPSRTMNSAPDGEYMTITFRTKFARKALCYERVTLSTETGRWQVSGYQIQ